jgi:hypothetical protein
MPYLASFAISIAGPAAAPAIHALAVTNPIWEGVFFGAFGAVNALIEPAFGGFLNLCGFGDRVKRASEITESHSRTVVRTTQPLRDGVESAEMSQPTGTKFQDMVATRQAADQQLSV